LLRNVEWWGFVNYELEITYNVAIDVCVNVRSHLSGLTKKTVRAEFEPGSAQKKEEQC